MNKYGWQWEPIAHVLWTILFWISVLCACHFGDWHFLIMTAAVCLLQLSLMLWAANPRF